MPRIAILSDIHGNLAALEAVLRDVETQKPDRIVCLGDTVGYGPFPRECFARVHEVAGLILAGNHELETAVPGDEGMEEDAREMALWSARALEGLEPWERMRSALVDGQAEALALRIEGKITWVHGAPEEPTLRYVWPGHRNHFLMLNSQLDQFLVELLGRFATPHGFCGHTHVPAVLTTYENRELFGISQDWNRTYTFVGPNTIFYVPLGTTMIGGLWSKKVVINPGSVGQPRDRDPRASWALYDGDLVTFRRVAYDVSATQAAIRALPVADSTRSYFADRLERGE
ncbi:metallophosphoesterase family protein [Hyalangium rubrum]|uniref:Metallophosphoesterase family protein n=1 Tax=Hyalangium rubrum TaxID=3103134 RepID=A0ABU5HB50_9BACT|nr:metallophosphoesterase family protein [Hyalangium sp. s54d21]MDY7230099.1 metallophosphoesterase family protein [Hyalangium sp. s54d21]